VNWRGGIVVFEMFPWRTELKPAQEAVGQLDQMAERPTEAAEPPDTHRVSGGEAFGTSANALAPPMVRC